MGLLAQTGPVPLPERELAQVKALYDSGNFDKAVERARLALGAAGGTEAQRVELFRTVGLASFNLGLIANAREAFLELLKLEPDAVLDPFVAPPPAIRLFEQVRTQNAQALELARQMLALRQEQARQEDVARKREAAAQAARIRQLEEAARTVLVRTVEKRALWMCFLPMGLAQLTQDRPDWAAFFGISTAGLASASVIAFLAQLPLFIEEPITLPDRERPFSLTRRYVPEERQGLFQGLQVMQLVTAGLATLLYIIGVGDALFHHRPEVITEKREPRAGTIELRPAGLALHL